LDIPISVPTAAAKTATTQRKKPSKYTTAGNSEQNVFAPNSRLPAAFPFDRDQ
jgi:hypothetical protein